MGIGDYVDKAKQALAGREDQVAGALDKAADAVKSRTGDSTDRKIDSAVDKAKDFLAKQGEHGHGESAVSHRDADPARPDEHRPAGARRLPSTRPDPTH
ncbi:antitoxin [Cellulomonas denverensis]|uniref:antitoxin n=1 Tax=Cellulomonas denverensis TaxID=264297 RepID=UPI0035EB40EC